jgi:hypothetical protein
VTRSGAALPTTPPSLRTTSGEAWASFEPPHTVAVFERAHGAAKRSPLSTALRTQSRLYTELAQIFTGHDVSLTPALAEAALPQTSNTEEFFDVLSAAVFSVCSRIRMWLSRQDFIDRCGHRRGDHRRSTPGSNCSESRRCTRTLPRAGASDHSDSTTDEPQRPAHPQPS